MIARSEYNRLINAAIDVTGELRDNESYAKMVHDREIRSLVIDELR
jgi:hypothetical protein